MKLITKVTIINIAFPLTLEHMMIACSKYDSERQKYFNRCISLADLFHSFSSNIILDYVKEIGIYRKL
jgi:hypothetical protein